MMNLDNSSKDMKKESFNNMNIIHMLEIEEDIDIMITLEDKEVEIEDKISEIEEDLEVQEEISMKEEEEENLEVIDLALEIEEDIMTDKRRDIMIEIVIILCSVRKYTSDVFSN